MGRSRGKHHKQSRRRQTEPLISTRREDGLWQSIERDEEEFESHFEDQASSFSERKSLVLGVEGSASHDITDHPRQTNPTITTPTLTPGSSNAPPSPDIKPQTGSPPEIHHPPTPTRADLLARVLNCPLHHPGLPSPVHPAPEIPQAVPPSPTQPHPATRKRRGRPRKSRNAPNWNKRRSVRFSDPILPDPEAQPEPRDTHVFVRMLKIIVTVEDPHPPQRQELVWNNRAKGWRLAGERSERNIGDIAELFDELSEHGSLLRVLLAPTVGRGAREPVEMGWNGARCCFQGANQDVGSLSVALGEMKDMVKDPWARQFVGHVLE